VVAETGGQTAGNAHFVALPGEPGTAEMAVTVPTASRTAASAACGTGC
jgi:hypothetical protein